MCCPTVEVGRAAVFILYTKRLLSESYFALRPRGREDHLRDRTLRSCHSLFGRVPRWMWILESWMSLERETARGPHCARAWASRLWCL